MNREFLGWDAMPLGLATGWLVDRFGDDLKDVLVALPGARSGRILGEALARAAGPRLRPPTIVTAGLASDKLLDVQGVPAGRLVRTLAWKEAIAGLDARTRARIVARSPAPDDLAAWMALAEEVRGLFGEVAADGLDFGDVAASERLASLDGERLRWEALADAQAGMQARLDEAGFVDPHLGRMHAIREGATNPWRAVVLVGVSEMNTLLRKAIDLGESPVTALIFAPPEEADAFDAHGALVPEAWAERTTSLDADTQWHVVEGPADQAAQTARTIAGFARRYAAEQVSIGLANREVGPHLEALMGDLGVRARDAAGTPMAETRPMRLLSAVGRLVEGGRFADLAELVRHPDFEAALRAADPDLEPVSGVDAYHAAHLPVRIDDGFLADPRDARDRALRDAMQRLWDGVRGLLGPLLGGGARPLDETLPLLRVLLQKVYGDLELDPEVEADRVLAGSLQRVGDGLADLQGLPSGLVPGGTAADTLALLVGSMSGDEVPPRAARPGEPTLEMLGWLELALDDAPALVVTGFEDGRVPESLRGDAFLPGSLRRSLGLADDRARLARDLYATELLLHSRERVAFVTGRRSGAGDPQLPSRIAFHCDPAQSVARVERFLHGRTPARTRVRFTSDEKRELPRLAEPPPFESIPVTAFRDYLTSPYLYYLRYVARLDTLDDKARELDPLGFGSLAHEVLQHFGEDEGARDERDADAIARWLDDRLRTLSARRYGSRPLPAVRLQIEQLAHRLGVFALRQAERRAEGWVIQETEWEPEGRAHALDVDGVPIDLRGRIDRIDFHPGRGTFAIWDYKTGDTVEGPLKTHRKPDGEWKDLQLPLYCVLAAPLLGEAEPEEVGFIALPRDPAQVRFAGTDRWQKGDDEPFADGVDSALETARDVVRAIRRGELFTDEGFAPGDPILAAIGGVGVLETADDDADGADEGDES